MKISKIFLGVSVAGVISFLCAIGHEASEWGLSGAFGHAYASVFGVILVASLLYQIGYLISFLVKRSQQKKQDTDSQPKWFKALFAGSFVPAILLIIYSLSSYFCGFTFIFSTYYGWQAVYDTLFFTGLIFCMIPVLPLCLMIQIVYIIKAVKRRRSRRMSKQCQEV